MSTPITDERVREFLKTAGSFRHYCLPRNEQMLTEWSEFLASKQAKDWEIVSFKSKTIASHWIWELQPNGMYRNNNGSEFVFGRLMDSNDGSDCVANGRMYINSV